MDIEKLAFIFGCILILIGLLGGGLELKELKIPKVIGWPIRLVAIIAGFIFIGLGLYIYDKLQPKPMPTNQLTQPHSTIKEMNNQLYHQPSVPTTVNQETHGPNSPAIHGVQGATTITIDKGGRSDK